MRYHYATCAVEGFTPFLSLRYKTPWAANNRQTESVAS